MESSVSLSTGQVPSNATEASPEPMWGANIVAFGGGTGLSRLLSGLKHHCFPSQTVRLSPQQKQCLTAIVTVSDDGGSSSILRKAYSILAPGDIRNCLLALSGANVTMKDLFGFRFNGELSDHSLGNLILTALTQLENDFARAIEIASEFLDTRGVVLPATLDDVTIKARYKDGSVVFGESSIREAGRAIDKISLCPARGVTAQAEVINAINRADLIIFGPGSLYTSIVPSLIVPGTAEAIATSRAKKLLIMNLMTEPGETDNYDATDFLEALKRHVPLVNIDYVLLNNTPLSPQLLAEHRLQGSEPIRQEGQSVTEFGCTPVFKDLAMQRNTITHDPEKLAAAISALFAELSAWCKVRP